jgi:hypothetical protein
MKVLIINFNRVTLPAALADWVAARGCEAVFVDNSSYYPPLLEYYKTTPHQVVKLDRNYGHTVLWQAGMRHILRSLVGDDRYIVTDPDLDLAGVPDDFLQVLNRGLDVYATYDKCGLSLEINDLPDNAEGQLVRTRYERKYWMRPLDDMYYHADTDTTFALYREGVVEYNHNAIRTNRPYTARHVPWYYLNLRDIPEDEQYYFRTANGSSSGKQRLEQL